MGQMSTLFSGPQRYRCTKLTEMGSRFRRRALGLASWKEINQPPCKLESELM